MRRWKKKSKLRPVASKFSKTSSPTRQIHKHNNVNWPEKRYYCNSNRHQTDLLRAVLSQFSSSSILFHNQDTIYIEPDKNSDLSADHPNTFSILYNHKIVFFMRFDFSFIFFIHCQNTCPLKRIYFYWISFGVNIRENVIIEIILMIAGWSWSFFSSR